MVFIFLSLVNSSISLIYVILTLYKLLSQQYSGRVSPIAVTDLGQALLILGLPADQWGEHKHVALMPAGLQCPVLSWPP